LITLPIQWLLPAWSQYCPQRIIGHPAHPQDSSKRVKGSQNGTAVSAASATEHTHSPVVFADIDLSTSLSESDKPRMEVCSNCESRGKFSLFVHVMFGVAVEVAKLDLFRMLSRFAESIKSVTVAMLKDWLMVRFFFFFFFFFFLNTLHPNIDLFFSSCFSVSTLLVDHR
jgi:hypothetical protein